MGNTRTAIKWGLGIGLASFLLVGIGVGSVFFLGSLFSKWTVRERPQIIFDTTDYIAFDTTDSIDETEARLRLELEEGAEEYGQNISIYQLGATGSHEDSGTIYAKIKNVGMRTVSTLELTAFLLDDKKLPVAEIKIYPLSTEMYERKKLLKPNYEMDVTRYFDVPPSWTGGFSLNVTGIWFDD